MNNNTAQPANCEGLEKLRQRTREDHEYFSNRNKECRERYVTALFLSFCGIEYDECELLSQEQASKTDVIFRKASFQIKELMDEDNARGSFLKDFRHSCERASSISEISFTHKAHDISPCAKMYDLVQKMARERRADKKYANEAGNLDLLIYATRTRASLLMDSEINLTDFSEIGWRSVSCVNEHQAAVLYASDSAPLLLRQRAGRILTDNRTSLAGV